MSVMSYKTQLYLLYIATGELKSPVPDRGFINRNVTSLTEARKFVEDHVIQIQLQLQEEREERICKSSIT